MLILIFRMKSFVFSNPKVSFFLFLLVEHNDPSNSASNFNTTCISDDAYVAQLVKLTYLYSTYINRIQNTYLLISLLILSDLRIIYLKVQCYSISQLNFVTMTTVVTMGIKKTVTEIIEAVPMIAGLVFLRIATIHMKLIHLV